MTQPLLHVRGLGLDVPDLSAQGRRDKAVRAILQDVNFSVEAGQALGVIGESGSGKSSLARALTLLMPPQRGFIEFDGAPIGPEMDATRLRDYRASLQLVFQDPMSALNPRRRVGASIVRPLEALNRLNGQRPEQAAAALLDRVGLPVGFASRYPHELSGGQRQRVNIARALALKPKVLIADEVTSGLDVSAQARIVELLESLRRDERVSLIFISHDLSLVRSLCDSVLILRGGHVVESGNSAEVFAQPRSEYTRKLLDSIPLPVPDAHWLDAVEG
ncbi:ABC transporter ATP-binding protein [Aquabacterium soli]|uniref:ABC transporter ATP-binding protein n=1 Tax=Aquabacterium soli TaxID=2493092 RepID=A0A3R8S098_9BURK|nr:ATP-binding cassette domain-containing protein [Aquabacterium soli]RRS02392.1 ABC transporter ATP-binding protein [Aquabacterium soli]